MGKQFITIMVCALLSIGYSPVPEELLASNDFQRQQKAQLSTPQSFRALLSRKPLARLGSPHFRQPGSIYSLAFSSDGNLLAGGDDKGYVRLWNVRTGEESGRGFRYFKTGNAFIRSVNFSPKGNLLAVGGNNCYIQLWSTASRKLLHQIFLPKMGSSSVSFSPNGKLLVGGWDWTMAIWEVSSGKKVRDLHGHSDTIRSVAFSPDGQHLASGGMDKVVRLWDVRKGRTVRNLRGHRDDIEKVLFSPDGKTLASADFENTIRFWEVKTGREKLQIDAPAITSRHMTFTPDGKTLITGGSRSKRPLRFWNVQTGKEIHHSIHVPWVSELALSPNGKILAVSTDRCIRLWNLQTGKELHPPVGHQSPVSKMAFSPDRKILASASSDWTVQLWDVSTGRIRNVVRNHTAPVSSVSFSPNGQFLAAGDLAQTIRIYDVATGKQIRKLGGKIGMVVSLDFSPNGKRLVSGEWEGSLRLWDVSTGKQLFQAQVHAEQARIEATFADRGKVIFVRGCGMLRMYDARSGKLLRNLGGEENRFAHDAAICTTLDQRTIISSSPEGKAAIRESSTGRLLRQLPVNIYKINPLAVSPDGHLLANSEGLWELTSGALCCPSGTKGSWAESMAFSQDGRMLAVALNDATILLYDIASLLGNRGTVSRPLSPESLQRLWTALGQKEASQGYRALWSFVAAPRQGVAFLKQRLSPVAPVGPEGIQKLISSLEDDQFSVREDATERLAKIGELAQPALLKRLAKPISLDGKIRVRKLLKLLHRPIPPGDQLRTLRSILALEQIGSKTAMALLKRLSSGASASLITQEAKAALERLAIRQKHQANQNKEDQ